MRSGPTPSGARGEPQVPDYQLSGAPKPEFTMNVQPSTKGVRGAWPDLRCIVHVLRGRLIVAPFNGALYIMVHHLMVRYI